MELFRRIVFAAVLAGALAGLGYAAIQQWRVVPLILEAETYETADHHHDSAADHDETVPHSHAQEAEPWAPTDGFERTAYTTLATTLAGVGFALIMNAISLVSGIAITPQNGVIWGLAGFATFSLAPAFGLPPELPGMAAADLVARQVWWWGTALATGVAIFAIARFRTPWVILGALVVIAIPHILGAPIAPEEHSDLPAHLATAFAAASLASALMFWLAMGTLLGWANARFSGANT